jgi:F-box interacting protein
MVDPSFSFLPAGHRDACIIDPCNGLLLCERVGTRPHFGSRYFVCNPATEEWIDLPDTEATASFPTVRLGFDPAVSSHFRVFVLVDAKATFELHLAGIEIYSSENGAWTYRQTEWGDGTVAGWNSVFFKGTLHLTSPDSSSLLTVDIDANKWGEIPTPRDFHFIGVSQGQLHAVHISNRCNNHNRNNRLSIWVLEDYAGQQWTLKHEVDAMQMFGRLPGSFGDFYHLKVHAIHPEHGLIFLTAGKLRSLMSYNMDEKKVRFIWILGERNVSACPYVPCFSDWLPPGH